MYKILSMFTKIKKENEQQLLAQIMQHKKALDQDNIAYTNEAIKIAEFLLHPMKPIVVENKPLLEQQLKEQFTNALLEQQKINEHKINIYKNITQFNNAINEM